MLSAGPIETCDNFQDGIASGMTATQVIDQIRQLPPSEQVEVIHFAFELAKTRQLTGEELGELADRLATAEDPAEITRLKSAMTRGFYGE